MSESAPMMGPPDGSFAEAPYPEQPSGNLEGATTDLFSTTKQVLRGSARNIAETGALLGPEGEPVLADMPEQKVDSGVLNKQYGIPGKLSFSDALPDSVAQSMYQTKIAEMKRQDVERRAPPGFLNGTARFGAEFAVGLLDPLQLGAAMVPVAPEIELGTSLAARIGGRALSQGVGGLVATAPLVGLQYDLSRQEQSDYTAYDALFGLAQGAGFGAGIGALEAGGGAFGRALSQRYRASRAVAAAQADPGIAPAALRTGLGQLEQDNPVEARPVYDQSNSPNVPEDYGEPSPLQEGGTRGARAFLPENEPLGLTSFLQRDFTVGRPGDINSERRAGGLRDAGGDVDAIIGGPKGRPGLINNESGSSLSEAANRAYEAGYFDHVPDENELLDAIAKDHNRTNPHDAIYSSMDQDQADAYRYARDHNVEVSKMSDETGIPTEGQTPTQFWDQVADHLSQEESQAHVDRLGAEHDEAFGQAEQAAKEWVAYHGTPHEFDQFDTAHIGTGEGAQAYGHGLYFAEREGVAESYRNQLSPVADDALSDAKAALRRTGGDLDAAIEDNRTTWKDPTNKYAAQVEGILKHWKTNGVSDEVPPVGHLYTVHVKAKPEEMLDWDKSSKDQSPEVRAAMKRVMPDWDVDHPGINGGQAFYQEFSRRQAVADPDPMAQQPFNDNPKASRLLHEAGIKGIRYRDAQSRAREYEVHFNDQRWHDSSPSASDDFKTSRDLALRTVERHGDVDRALTSLKDNGGRSYQSAADWLESNRDHVKVNETGPEPTHNVVVFDHNDVEITHRNGEPVERKPFDSEEVYRGAPHTLEDMEHEWRQAEAANPILSGEGGGGQPGTAAEYPGDVQGGTGQVPGTPGVAGRAGPEDRSQILQSALRDAAGRKPPDPTSLAAERSLKEGSPENLVKQAQQDIEDHTAFFQAAEAAGQLTEDVRAELEKIGNLDKEAADLTAAAKQAAACIARGMA